MALSLSRQLVGHHGVDSSFVAALQAALAALQGHGDCYRSREVKPQGTVSHDVDRHHLREGFPDGLLECQISGFDTQVPPFFIYTSKDVTAGVGSHKASVEHFVPRGWARMHPLQWQLK